MTTDLYGYRIKELCQKVIEATDPAEAEQLLAELKELLHEHILHLRAKAKNLLAA